MAPCGPFFIFIVQNPNVMLTQLKQILGYQKPSTTPLEIQVANTTFRSAIPDTRMDYNDWSIYISNQLRGSKLVKRKRKK